MGKILSLYAPLPRTYDLTIALVTSDMGKVAMGNSKALVFNWIEE